MVPSSRPHPDVARTRICRACEEAHLETVFQPLVDLDSNKCIAYEALTRFPDDPAWTTGDWFATAKEVGLAAELELAAIAAALDHLDEIPPTTALAINVSTGVAVTDEFFVLVARVAHRLIIELTEHDLVDDYELLANALAGLRRLGARIAVDDVSAGAASLRHVLNLRPDIVKLDLTATHGHENEPGARSLAAMVQFAGSTGALIAAEGIETEGELELLRELGVDQGQGYFLGRPGPLEPQLD